MFKPNDQHHHQTLFDATMWMSPNIKAKLEKSWAKIFYEEVFLKIDEKPFAILYSDTGRSNFPVNILLSLEFIKHMKNISDEEIIERYYFDYLVNYAVGNRAIGQLNLALRTLYYFRKRLALAYEEHPEGMDLIFNQFKKLLDHFVEICDIETNEQRMDTTLFQSNIKKAGRMALAYDVLLRLVKAFEKKDLPASLRKALEPDFKTDVIYKAKGEEYDSKLELLLNLINEAACLCQALPSSSDPDALRIAKRFLKDQSVLDHETGMRRAKPNKEIRSDSLQSAYDEDATFRAKGSVRQSGYVLELAETCSDANDFQLITDYSVAPNNTSDTQILEERYDALVDTGCTDLYVDGGFHSPIIHDLAKEKNIKIHLTNMTGRKSESKMELTRFETDPSTHIIKRCPAGFKPLKAEIKKGKSVAYFSLEACSKCELFNKCYSKKLKKQCVVRVGLESIKTSKERLRMQTHRKENTSKRAAIEGTNGAMKSKGMGKLRVRGIIRTRINAGYKTIGQNISRVTRFLLGGYAKKPKLQPQLFLACQGF